MIRNIFVKIHAYLGLITSLFLALMALSGTFLVFRNEYIKLSLGNLQNTIPNNHNDNLTNILSQNKIENIKSILLPSEQLPFYKLSLKNGIAYYDNNAKLIEQSAINQRLDEFIFQFHHFLLMGKNGEPYVGFIGVFCFIMVLIGVYLWLRTWKTFDFSAFPKGFKRRQIISHHRNLGIIFAIPILLISFSGASMIFDDFAKSTIAIFTQIKPQKSKPIEIENGIITPQTILTGYEIAQNEFKNSSVRYIILPQKPNAPLNIRLKQPKEWHPNGRTIAAINYKENKIGNILNAQKIDITSRIYNSFYPLHSGKTGGLLYKIIIALSGMALFMLSIFSAFSYSRHLLIKKS